MSNEIAHSQAYYRDLNGVLQVIEAESLSRPEVLQIAEMNYLTDEDEQFRLFAKPGNIKRPHFSIFCTREVNVFRGENSKDHNERVHQLNKRLNKLNGKWMISYLNREKHETVEYRPPQYTWGTEVTRHIAKGIAVRHDIFGTSDLISSSYLRPSIAIEVIHSHYPEELAFESMLRYSEISPYWVIFEHTRRWNAFLKINDSDSKFQYTNNTYHIKEGCVWLGHDRTNISTSAGLRIAFEGLINQWDDYHSRK